ncbi:hypothetical protein IFM89_016618 [Coptis chinensis]|uniref:Phytosulfokine n=1 Tax=Coptis chinensis TaxID=261450 RepID=A0A835IPI1_9MAGN|nr:hypothetical protein IFM89_016618 [Coptis chinensis]
MSKVSSVFMIAILLFFTLTFAARSNPVLPKDSPVNNQQEHVGAEMEVDQSCEGIGEEECLMRRTLVAHTDYIYTQKNEP